MEVNMITKKKILDLLKQNSIDNLFYSDYQEIIKISKQKITNSDILSYLSTKATNELDKKESLSINLFSKILFSIAIIVKSSINYHIPLTNSTIKEINQMLVQYQEQVTAKTIIPNAIIEHETSDLKAIIWKYYSEILQEKDTASAEKESFKEELTSAKELIEEYEMKLNDLKQAQHKLEKELKKSKITSENLENAKVNFQKTISTLTEELTTKKMEINDLLLQNQQQDLKIAELSLIVTSLKEQFLNLKTLNDQLTKKLEETEQNLGVYQMKETKSQQDEMIRTTILQELYNHPVSISQLINRLSQLKCTLTSQEVYNHLNALKLQGINISGPVFDTIPPTYKISSTPSHVPIPFYLPISSSELDVLVISDIHKANQDFIPEIDMSYNYATKNGIQYIINLGDTIDYLKYNPKRKATLEDYQQIEQLIVNYAEQIPQNTGVYQLLLGGNHEMFLLHYGIDALNRLEQYHPDLINLGYSYTNIVLGKTITNNNVLGLHHPTYRLEEEIGEWGNGFSKVKNYLFDAYLNQAIKRENVYCDLIGHLHRSKLDLLNSYCQVASLTKDRVQNGALHVKIYRNKTHDIECIIFIPLIVMGKELIKVTEVPYEAPCQKVKRLY